jgi:hypothetical protein
MILDPDDSESAAMPANPFNFYQASTRCRWLRFIGANMKGSFDEHDR